VRSFDDVPLDRASLLSEHDPELRVRGTSPLVLCGLALSGANLPMDAAGRQPGLVTAQEIAALDLSCCELAVLSACDTNVGVRRAGQGVASLQRALHMAGARSTITSLWRVPDEATRELMTDFYRRMWIVHTPKAEALWAAKKRLRDARDEDGRPKYEPRDWAGWILRGDPRWWDEPEVRGITQAACDSLDCVAAPPRDAANRRRRCALPGRRIQPE